MSHETVDFPTGTPGGTSEAPFRHRVDLPVGVSLGFTGVAAGNLGLHVEGSSDPQDNRRLLERAMGVLPGTVLFMEQVHGTHVVRADDAPSVPAGTDAAEERRLAPTADAAVTTSARPLAVMTADCLPVILTTESATTYGVAHAGRRGLLDGVLPRVFDALRDAGAREVHAWIGPAVCGRCYEVPQDMAETSESELPGIRVRTRWDTPGLDLSGAAETQLSDLGAVVHRGALNECTYESDAVYSHRRAPGQGRIAGLVWSPAHSRRWNATTRREGSGEEESRNS